MNTIATMHDGTLKSFLGLSRKLAGLNGMNDIVLVLSDYLSDTVKHDHLALVFRLSDDYEFGVVFETGMATDWANSQLHPVRLHETPLRRVFDGTVGHLLVGDAMTDPRFREKEMDWQPLSQAKSRSWICLPMHSGEKVVGALGISLNFPDSYWNADLEFARDLLDFLTPFLLSVFREKAFHHTANLSAVRAADVQLNADGNNGPGDIADRMPGVVYRFLAKGNERRMTFVAPRALEMFGLDPNPEGFVERFVARVHPDERSEFFASINEVVEAGAPWYYQGRFLRPDGKEITFVGISQPSVTPEGLLYHGILMDTSEQMRNEATFRRLSLAIDSIEHGVAILDSDDRFFYVNRRYRAFAETAQETLQVGCRFEDHLRQLVELGVVSIAETNRESWIQNRMDRHKALPSSTMLEQKGGEWLLVREERLPDGGIAMIVTDVSELRQAQDRLKEALTCAETASLAKSEFLATMSHEFRTPLNAILGFSDIMCKELLGAVTNPSYARYARDIHDSGRHMLDLVNDVLEFSALDAGKREFRVEPVDVAATISRCLREVQHAADDKQIEVGTCNPIDLAEFETDPRALRQCLINTLANAVKYTESNGRVDVASSINDAKLQIVVKDNGAGIAADRLDSITEPFAQGNNDPMRAKEGTGLGLSIVKSLLEGQGGMLKIESTLGVGTTVTMTLPRAA